MPSAASATQNRPITRPSGTPIDDGDAVADDERLQALQQRGAELAVAHEVDEGREDRARIGAENRIDVAAEIFP